MRKKGERCLECKVGTLVEVATHGRANLKCDYCGRTYVEENQKSDVQAGKTGRAHAADKVERVPADRRKSAPQRRCNK